MRAFFRLLFLIGFVLSIALGTRWYLTEKPYQQKYKALGLIEIAPRTNPILFELTEDKREFDKDTYLRFKESQAKIILTENILLQVAHFLPNDYPYLKDDMNLYQFLKHKIEDGSLKATSYSEDQFVYVELIMPLHKDAADIVNAILDSYMVNGASQLELENQMKINMLKDNKLRLEVELSKLREEKKNQTDQGLSLDQYDILKDRLANIQDELNELMSKKRLCEIKCIIQENDNSQARRTDFYTRYHRMVDADQTYKNYKEKLAEYETKLVELNVTKTEDDPERGQLESMILAFRNSLKERESIIHSWLADEYKIELEGQLVQSKHELSSITTHEKILKEELDRLSEMMKDVTLFKYRYEDLEEKTLLTKEIITIINRRIKMLYIEGCRPAKIKIRSKATLDELPPKYFPSRLWQYIIPAILCLIFFRAIRPKHIQKPKTEPVQAK